MEYNDRKLLIRRKKNDWIFPGEECHHKMNSRNRIKEEGKIESMHTKFADLYDKTLTFGSSSKFQRKDQSNTRFVYV